MSHCRYYRQALTMLLEPIGTEYAFRHDTSRRRSRDQVFLASFAKAEITIIHFTATDNSHHSSVINCSPLYCVAGRITKKLVLQHAGCCKLLTLYLLCSRLNKIAPILLLICLKFTSYILHLPLM